MQGGDGSRRRRRIQRHDCEDRRQSAMRYGARSQLARQDCPASRRSTVMRALLWATTVTTGYQRDSSSKRPRSSVVFATRHLPRPPSQDRGLTTGHSISGYGGPPKRFARRRKPRAHEPSVAKASPRAAKRRADEGLALSEAVRSGMAESKGIIAAHVCRQFRHTSAGGETDRHPMKLAVQENAVPANAAWRPLPKTSRG